MRATSTSPVVTRLAGVATAVPPEDGLPVSSSNVPASASTATTRLAASAPASPPRAATLIRSSFVRGRDQLSEAAGREKALNGALEVPKKIDHDPRAAPEVGSGS